MIAWLKPLLFAACAFPAAQLAYEAYTGDLGVNPIEYITRFTGSWSLIILIASLAVTPLRRLTGRNDLVKLRRMLGLFAFFYAALHFATYMGLDLFFDFSAIGKDIIKRPYITVGFLAFLIMIPLAATSTAGMIRRLGKRWQQLHRLVYVAAILGVIHFYWAFGPQGSTSTPTTAEEDRNHCRKPAHDPLRSAPAVNCVAGHLRPTIRYPRVNDSARCAV